ncbi:zinc-binding dehydrogenase [Streptomyces sp. MP131-18]|uniref:zinc-binding dehydrogenase n=1 Tax=Streptomyces sp. MP131-18 TaxID=1857892 RepID=UPI00097C43E9|nr:zinc-binding dehydrogenase [Streptomyces sp. MP131-18]
MQEIRVAEFGGPEVLVPAEVPDPVPGPGQVVIATAAVDTIFVEAQIRSGAARDWFPADPPFVPGSGVAGHIAATGPGVDPSWRGRPVVTVAVTNGAYTQRAVAALEDVVPVPDGLGLREAAALAHDGVTAMRLFEPMRPRAGTWVLVTAAAGGMGVLLVQLARAAGARVIGAARGARKLALVRDLGAEAAVDYTLPGWADQVRARTGDQGVDLVWDGAGGEAGSAAFGLVADGGRFSAHGAPGGGFFTPDPAEAARRGIELRGIEHLQLPQAERTRQLARVVEAAAAGQFRPVIGRTFPLADAAAAHSAIERRDTLGKTLLLP